MAVILRDLQWKGIRGLKGGMMVGHRKLLFTAPPGAGKTLMAAHMILTAMGKDFDCLFICNRIELIEQTAEAFTRLDIPYGIIGGGYTPDPMAHAQIASIDTLKRSIKLRRTPKLIIWDECRGIGAVGWTKVFNAFPNAYHIGLDATPIRTDSKSLGEYFTHLVCGPVYSELKALGILVPFKVYAPSIPDMSGVKTVKGDFDRAATQDIMDKPMLVGDIALHFKRHAAGKQGLTFGCSRIHSEHLAACYRDAGISAVHLDGDTDKKERKRIVAAFKRREIQVLCNCALFTAGFDVPGIEVITDAAPTQSIAIAVQRWGRGSRAEVGKEHCVLFDHSGNVFRHQLPDTDRHWTLDKVLGEKKSKGQSEKPVGVRQCPHCFACCEARKQFCPECGKLFEVQSRQIDQKDGELVEISAVDEFRRKAELQREVQRAKTLAELVAIGKARNYKSPFYWAKRIHDSRRAKA